tara:strand:- start:121 stop:348 length:228 start_codon:yes stop_codon:yes gene_type:complete
MSKILTDIFSKFDLTSVFKDKRFGDMKRWSSKRTIGSLVIGYAISVDNGQLSWQCITLCLIGILPLCLSMFESRS